MILGWLGHVALALAMQGLIDRLTRSRIAGAAAAVAWFVAREITQAEYRWIERFGGGLRAHMPWWGGFDVRVWDHADHWLDWLLPTLAVTIVGVWRTRASHSARSRP